MRLEVYGVNHSTTPIGLREKLVVTASRLDSALAQLHRCLESGVILSTCNRTEIYSIAKTDEQAAIFHFFSEWSDVAQEGWQKHVYRFSEDEAARHLFEVAAGLDSMIIGEYEVLGQVKKSLEGARSAGMVSFRLNRLFSHAILAGRRVRAETEISRNSISVSSLAVDLAESVIKDVSKSRCLVIGAGEAGFLAAEAIVKRDGNVAVYNRSPDRAKALVDSLGRASIAEGNLKEEIALSDIVISCTSAPHPIIGRELVAEVVSSRPERPLVLIDIAVPRDIEETVKGMPGVSLYDIDDLNQMCSRNRSKRLGEVSKARTVLNEEIIRFNRWWRSLDSRPVIQALYQKAETICSSQLETTFKKNKALSDEEKLSIEAMSQSIVHKLLHSVVDKVKLNGGADVDYGGLVKDLFELEVEDKIEN